ncbi:MAG: M56 family metallopeptidase [Ornithinimicrobium sp.]|uniref:M56 family metallopeptidase n=1 Tax=Ornithinimicrobium sp. TaxID=1977084 RepID=UPI0026DFD607|nr:M56 family metallopeptidase [Ornithinimicrobium sp.]MDO5739917.1 M56 family metallopeptidase [Ornithinimicrobium sp.]
MTGALVTAALIGCALVLTLLAPNVLARWTAPRLAPAQGLLLWQSISIAGVLCALLAAPVAALTLGLRQPTLLGMAIAVSALMLARVLWSGHRVGTDLRRRRSRHRLLVDLVGERLEGPQPGSVHTPRPLGGVTLPGSAPGTRVAVVAQANPTAYCLPGRHDRIVLSQAALDRLDHEGLSAVLAHERAHLVHRHDLLLELFTVLHEAVPGPVRSPAALREVHLLAEALADRAAAVACGATSLARALVAMATRETPNSPATPPTTAAPSQRTPAVPGSPYPDTAGGAGQQVGTRLRLLAAPSAPVLLAPTLTALAGLVAFLPFVLVAALLI